MKIIEVDENDNEIGLRDRKDRSGDFIYRVSALWVINSKGDILLAQRALDKEHDPGKWGPAVAGTVEEGETYFSNIVKEAEEEIGLKNINPTAGPKIKREGRWKYFGQWYFLTVDKSIEEFKVSEREVAGLKWFGKAELEKALSERLDDFLPSVKVMFEKG